MKALAGFILTALFFSFQAQALEISEDFSSRSHLESATAVWNQALGKIHPTLQVVNYLGGNPFTPRPFEIGDGSDGLFAPSTYSRFSLNGDLSGNKIRLDTSRFPVLNVTSFHLAPGWILEPTGNVPLVIHSLTDVRIEGEIWCHGGAGDNATGATPGAGGVPRCGGKAGGQGGAPNQLGEPGEDASVVVTGGQGGGYSSGPAKVCGGGGGGSWNTSNLPADNVNSATGCGGGKGNSQSDAEFTILAGGAGGGGGGGTPTDGGAGGGAGGGVVIIHAVGNVEFGSSTNSTSGFIFANGGKGGNSNAGGGPGGGGAGGSVQVFSGATIHLFNDDGDGASQANRGAGGVNTVPETGATGGEGRSWFASVAYIGESTAYYSPGEDNAAGVVPDDNTVEFVSSTQSVITKSKDLLSTLASMDSFSISPSSADFQLEFKGSSDDFKSDETAWTANLSEVSHKRFIKMKISIMTSTPASPAMVDLVKFNYTPGMLRDYDFKNTGCGVVSPKGPTPPWSTGLLFLPLFFILLVKSRFRRQRV